MWGRLTRGLPFAFDGFFASFIGTSATGKLLSSLDGRPQKATHPGRVQGGLLHRRAAKRAGTPSLFSVVIQNLYSESQLTVKLDPSVLRADGTASFAPVVPLTIMASCTPVPKSLIGPVMEESVA